MVSVLDFLWGKPTEMSNVETASKFLVRESECIRDNSSRCGGDCGVCRINGVGIVWNALDSSLTPGSGSDVAFGIVSLAVGSDSKSITARSEGGGNGHQKVGLGDVSGSTFASLAIVNGVGVLEG